MQPKEGIEAEFNMDLKSKERVHDMLDYLNRATADPVHSFTPEDEFRIWIRIYSETRCIMNNAERDKLDDMKKKLTEKYNDLIKFKSHPKNIMRTKAMRLSGELNGGLDIFGMELMDVLQAHKYLYREAADIHKAVLKR